MLAYLVAMSVTAGIYALMALGVNLTWGMAGMVNLGLAGFFAVGGYTTALLTKAGAAIPVGVLAGGAVGGGDRCGGRAGHRAIARRLSGDRYAGLFRIDPDRRQ